MRRNLTRREFIKSGTSGLLSLGAVGALSPLLGEGYKPRVVLARDPLCIDDRNRCDAVRVKTLFNKTLLSFTGKTDTKSAWNYLGLTSKDTVAVKINCNTWTVSLTPHKELIDAMCNSLGEVIPLNNIIIYERTSEDLRDGGFTINRSSSGVRFFGNDEGGGYDENERLTRIITKTCSKIINLASLKCVESDFGLSLFFKNHIGSLRDEDMSKCHGNSDFLAAVSARPSIKNKTILSFCDGLRGSYRRGVPWYWAGIIMGKDAVAAEYTALQVVNEKRLQEKLSALETPEHLKIAASKYKLGTYDPGSIDKVSI
jgi:hypothetical protein